MNPRPLSLVSIGECTIDRYLDLDREFVGGISLNFAVNARRAGAERVSFISRMGGDRGERILATLRGEEVDASRAELVDGVTAQQDILLTSDGDRIFPPGGYSSGVLDDWLLREDQLRFAAGHDVMAAALFKQVEPLFRQLMSQPYSGWRVADFLDLSDYDGSLHELERCAGALNIAFLSGSPDTVEKLRPLSRATGCVLVVTLGARGSAALLKGEPLFQRALDVANIVDSTGCGDAFGAGFTVSYWRHRDLRRALESGAHCAARVLQHLGATG